MSAAKRHAARAAAEPAAEQEALVLVVAVIPARHPESDAPRMVPWHDPPRKDANGNVIMRAIEQGVPHGGHQVVTARIPLSVLLEHVESVSEPDVLALQVARASSMLTGDAA